MILNNPRAPRSTAPTAPTAPTDSTDPNHVQQPHPSLTGNMYLIKLLPDDKSVNDDATLPDNIFRWAQQPFDSFDPINFHLFTHAQPHPQPHAHPQKYTCRAIAATRTSPRTFIRICMRGRACAHVRIYIYIYTLVTWDVRM
jgi:hypothetical protein